MGVAWDQDGLQAGSLCLPNAYVYALPPPRVACRHSALPALSWMAKQRGDLIHRWTLSQISDPGFSGFDFVGVFFVSLFFAFCFLALLEHFLLRLISRIYFIRSMNKIMNLERVQNLFLTVSPAHHIAVWS